MAAAMLGACIGMVKSGSAASPTHLPPSFLPAQRGDAEVSQKLWRVVRACVELGEKNPIEQIHDQVGGTWCGFGVVGGWMGKGKGWVIRTPIEHIHDQASIRRGGMGSWVGEGPIAHSQLLLATPLVQAGTLHLAPSVLHSHSRTHSLNLAALPPPLQLSTIQGAGGNCNVVKEIIYPLGAEIDVRAIRLGDKTMR